LKVALIGYFNDGDTFGSGFEEASVLLSNTGEGLDGDQKSCPRSTTSC